MAIKISGTTVIDDSRNIQNIGVATATTFSGNLTGNVTGNATGLSGSPSITVTGINASGVSTFSGIATHTASIFGTNLSLTGVSTFSGIATHTASIFGTNLSLTGVVTATSFVGSGLTITGISTATDTRLISVAEKSQILTGTTLSLVYNTGGSNIAIHTNPSADITLAVTGIPTDTSFNNSVLTFSTVLINTGTARSCTAVTLNGVSASIKWFGGSLANAISGVTTTTGTDIYTFTGINTVGSASTTTNYLLLGNVNGSYR